ncbi:polysaccharide deacetylase family protein [uncultured Draconibacterium sp.]|uniref:polysaccharide deacetylase family protein n=1 Tax=uncultured Draconibacterium sp. TaxID=1573823 RepID=UPI003261C573
MRNKLSISVFIRLILTATILFVLFGCRQTKQQGAVVFSFDDQYIDEWYSQRDLFNRYNIKATFFINRPHLLSAAQIEKLKQLQADGHEIGCHGLNHLNVVDYKDSVEVLVKKEIKPAIKILTEMGFPPSSFAHPFGKSLPEIDDVLLQHFKYLRKATYNINDTTIDFYNEIYATPNHYKVTNSMGIDTNYNISEENFETGLLRAVDRNEVLILHAHKTDSSLANYTVSPAYLESAFKLCRQHHLKSLRISDLENYFSGH